jgi:IclR family transcriptional regulator, KDG regulon repressor
MTVEHRSDNRNSTLQTLSRGLDLLQVLANAGRELGVRELGRTMELGPPMVQRLLNTLAAHGFVEQNLQTRKYAIGYRAFVVGKSYVTGSSVVEAALPVLRVLVADNDLNAYVGEIRDDYALYLLVLQSRGPVAVRATPGERALLHTTAMGKALLAAMEPEAVVRLLGPGPLPAKTPRSITDLSALLDDLARARSTGVAICDDENLPGVFAVGAPLRDANGNVIASVSLACPAAMADAAARTTIAAQVRAAAAQISRRMGASA